MNTNERKWSNYTAIVSDIKNIFEHDLNNSSECISLYDISMLYKKKYEEYNKIRVDFTSRNRTMISHFNYNNDELHIAHLNKYRGYKETIFSKKDMDLFESKKDGSYSKLLTKYGNELLKLYKNFLSFKDFHTQHSSSIESVNSKFLVSINAFEINIHTADDILTISSSTGFDNYDYKCDSNIIVSLFNSNEDELFKRIFVRISDCPEWCQSALIEIRKKELEKQKCKTIK